MIVPSIGTKGVFNFSAPFDTLLPTNQTFKVVSVRDLIELEDSNEKPYDTIYTSVGMTEADFKADIDAEVPIVVFVTEGKDYFYVPANKILSEGINTGYNYKEYTLFAVLGNYETNFDFNLVKTSVEDIVYNITGVRPFIEITPTSAEKVLSKTEHDTLKLTRDNIKTVDKSYMTSYLEILELYNKQKLLITNFETMFKNNICNP